MIGYSTSIHHHINLKIKLKQGNTPGNFKMNPTVDDIYHATDMKTILLSNYECIIM
jgi:hypothetical protein